MAPVAALPDGSRYTVAVQNPGVAFKDPRLKAGRPAVDRFGVPMVSAGGFAVAYRLETPSGPWAVRCFTRLTDGLEQRYAKVAQFIAANPATHWLSVDYQRDGLLVDRQWWPVTVMPWVDALPLNEWVAGQLARPDLLTEAAARLAAIARQLELAGVAHGDLQHGNVLVRSDTRLVLIDYDGMFVPGLEGQQMPEVGHPHYQHPGRGAATFGPGLDRFSAAVIWTALTALARMPGLWGPHDTGENLLFTARDFQSPGQSELLRSLRSNADLRRLAEGIERLLHVSVDRLPSLDEFVAGKLPEADPVTVNFGAVAPFPILDLRRPRVLDGRQGQRVTAVGEVVNLYRNRTYRGDPYLFVTIGSRLGEPLKIVLWSETLARLTATQSASLKLGSILGVTGTLGEYGGKPQIVLERAALLELLKSDRVADLLGSNWGDKPPVATTTRDLAVGDVVEHDKFGQGVVVAVRADVARVRFAAEVKEIQFTRYPLRFVRRPTQQASSVQGGSHGAVRPKADRGTTPASAQPHARPATGFAQQQDEWANLIAASIGGAATRGANAIRTMPGSPASTRANVAMGAPASASRMQHGQRTAARPAVWPAFALAGTGLVAAFVVAPSSDLLAIGLGIAGVVSGGVALSRAR